MGARRTTSDSEVTCFQGHRGPSVDKVLPQYWGGGGAMHQHNARNGSSTKKTDVLLTIILITTPEQLRVCAGSGDALCVSIHHKELSHIPC